MVLGTTSQERNLIVKDQPAVGQVLGVWPLLVDKRRAGAQPKPLQHARGRFEVDGEIQLLLVQRCDVPTTIIEYRGKKGDRQLRLGNAEVGVLG